MRKSTIILCFILSVYPFIVFLKTPWELARLMTISLKKQKKPRRKGGTPGQKGGT